MKLKFLFTTSLLLFCFLGCSDRTSRSPEGQKSFFSGSRADSTADPLIVGILMRFQNQFVEIPAGYLPALNNQGDVRFPRQEGIHVPRFEANPYPITREIWNEIMGGKPSHAPETPDEWISQPHIPVTHVAWENDDGTPAEIQDFLQRLNARLMDSGCTYDLPTDHQLWYMLRADMSGRNTDRYSHDVTESNIDHYVTHLGNSNGQIQPIGQKRLNGFGIELGNVIKITKDIFDSSRPQLGRVSRGGSWNSDRQFHGSNYRYPRLLGDRNNQVGFSLVRICH